MTTPCACARTFLLHRRGAARRSPLAGSGPAWPARRLVSALTSPCFPAAALQVVLECLNRLGVAFGTTTNSKGYRMLPPYVRLIQGDGVNIDAVRQILQLLVRRGGVHCSFRLAASFLSRWPSSFRSIALVLLSLVCLMFLISSPLCSFRFPHSSCSCPPPLQNPRPSTAGLPTTWPLAAAARSCKSSTGTRKSAHSRPATLRLRANRARSTSSPSPTLVRGDRRRLPSLPN